MNDAYAKDLVVALKDLVRHVASIDASLNKLTKLASDDGLRVETGIHQKLDKLTHAR